MSVNELETLDVFNERARTLRNKIKEYAIANVSQHNEHVLVVTHSRMINCFLEKMTWQTKEDGDRFAVFGMRVLPSDIFKREI